MIKDIFDTLRFAIKTQQQQFLDEGKKSENDPLSDLMEEFTFIQRSVDLNKLLVAERWLLNHFGKNKQSLGVEDFMNIAEITTRIIPYRTIMIHANSDSGQSLYTQEFNVKVMPQYNKTPKPSKGGGWIVSTAIGYKELIVWVHFGNNIDWTGPELRWMYVDRSIHHNGENISGGIDELDALYEVSAKLKKEAERIQQIEREYFEKHGNLDGLAIDGYHAVE